MEKIMTSFIQAITNTSRTQNGALTHTSSADALVDWFFQSGAMRHWEEDAIWKCWVQAFDANPQAAMRLLMYTRDVRQGQGERKVPRIVLRRLAMDPQRYQALAQNLRYIPEFGRWDDLFVCFNSDLEDQALSLISNALSEGNALCAKWMPREKSKRMIAGIPGYVAARKIREFMGISKRAYRKMRTRLNSVVETQMCAKEWDQIEFSKIPSQCALRSRKAFYKNCPERYTEYVEAVAAGTEKVNAQTLYPHQLVSLMLKQLGGVIYTTDYETEKELIKAQWAALPNYMENSTCRLLPVIDVSGSMHSTASPSPIEVALGLGIYIAERNVGPFQDTFMTFSDQPEVASLTGADIWEKVNNLTNTSWGFSTDIEKTFKEILHFATLHNVPEDEMPEKILIMSDMEFNVAVHDDVTTFQTIKEKYKKAGYRLPQIVFWNLAASGSNIPVRSDDMGAALISGFSTSILKQLLQTGGISPIELVLEVINDERYACINI